MKSREQKTKELDLGKDLVGKSQSLIFADFTGVDTTSIQKLKTDLKTTGASFRVLKKRLLKIAFKEHGIDFDPTKFDAQVGVIFSKGDVPDVAGLVYKFSKELAKKDKEFKILGAYAITEKHELSMEEFNSIAKLPPREILLAQVVGIFAAPIKAFMSIADKLSKKQENTGVQEQKNTETQEQKNTETKTGEKIQEKVVDQKE